MKWLDWSTEPKPRMEREVKLIRMEYDENTYFNMRVSFVGNLAMEATVLETNTEFVNRTMVFRVGQPFVTLRNREFLTSLKLHDTFRITYVQSTFIRGAVRVPSFSSGEMK